MANVFKIGDLEVIAVADGEVRFQAKEYFAGTTDEQWAAHSRWTDHEGKLVFPFGCFVVRSGDKRVLIDTGLGPITFGEYRGGELLGQLAEAGVKPGDIDVVFITHLHADHCGSAALKVDGERRATFPNATYRWTAAEQAHWTGTDLAGASVARSVSAVVGLRWEAADGGASLAPGIDVYAMPGHTPGHAGVVLSSGDARAFILGDGISCPVQLEEPEWSGLGDVDPKLARRSQEALAREVEGTGALVGTSHFPGLTFGRVLTGEGRRYWQPVG
jgi:glyoxylase-like metal-dependent hydrolase (beta-lactamase superfamily II)